MMLIITFHNDGTWSPPGAKGDYDVKVMVNQEVIWEGRCEGHWRYKGWVALLDKFVQERKDEFANQGQ